MPFEGYDVREGNPRVQRRRAEHARRVEEASANFKGYDATKGKPKSLAKRLLEEICKPRPTDNRKKKGGGGGKKWAPWCK